MSNINMNLGMNMGMPSNGGQRSGSVSSTSSTGGFHELSGEPPVATAVTPPTTGRKRSGRPRSTVWALFTDDPDPTRHSSTVCRNCHTKVKYGRKSEGARMHLMQCEPFLRSVPLLPPEQRPEWLHSVTPTALTHSHNQGHIHNHGYVQGYGHSQPLTTGSYGSGGVVPIRPKPKAVTGVKRSFAGRPPSPIWALFTEQARPNTMPAAVCKHCHTMVRYQRKAEKAKEHLLRCDAFHHAMALLPPEEWPEWWYPGVKQARATTVGDRKGGPLADASAAGVTPTLMTTPNKLGASATAASPAAAAAMTARHAMAMPMRAGPVLGHAEQDAVAEQLALFFYATDTPYERVEHPQLVQAFALCRPELTLPTAEELRGFRLEQTYARMKARVDRALQESDALCCLTMTGPRRLVEASDASSAHRVVDYALGNRHCSVFVESVSPPTNSDEEDDDDVDGDGDEQAIEERAEWIATDLGRVLTMQSGVTIAGACTEAGATHKRAWQLLVTQFPSKFFYGCVLQALQRLTHDVLHERHGHHGHELQHELDTLAAITSSCLVVLDFFQHDADAAAQLHALQDEQEQPRLAPTSTPTRCLDFLTGFRTLLKSEALVHDVVSRSDFLATATTSEQRARRAQVQSIVVTDLAFAQKLAKGAAVLEPIQELVAFFQRAGRPISDVFHGFATLKTKFRSLPGELWSPSEKEALVQASEARFAQFYGTAHGLSYVLDPRYVGQGIDDFDFREQLEDAIVEHPLTDENATAATTTSTSDDASGASANANANGGSTAKASMSATDRQAQLSTELTAYTLYAEAQKRKNGRRFQELIKGTISVPDWWQHVGERWPLLRQLARRLFALAPASTSAVRKGKAAHPRQRIRLASAAHDDKLAYVRANYAFFQAAEARGGGGDGEVDGSDLELDAI